MFSITSIIEKKICNRNYQAFYVGALEYIASYLS